MKRLKLLPLLMFLAAPLQGDIISVNVVKNITWNAQNISGGESWGLADYDGFGTSTVADTWNNVEMDTPSHLDIISSAGVTDVDLAIINPTASPAAPGTNETAYKAGLTLYGESEQIDFITASSVNTFSSDYDLIVFFSFGPNATSVRVNVNDVETVLTGPGGGGSANQFFVMSDLSADSLAFDVANDTPTGSGTAAVLGGFQIVDTTVPEPSTFAILAGLAALGLVMVRRR